MKIYQFFQKLLVGETRPERQTEWLSHKPPFHCLKERRLKMDLEEIVRVNDIDWKSVVSIYRLL
jgi:hypothetical protein